MKKRFLILSNAALAGLLTVMGCSKKVVSDPIIDNPDGPIERAEDNLPPLLYGPPPAPYDDGQQNQQDTLKNKKQPREPKIIDDERNQVKPLYGVPPAQFEPIEKN